MTRKEELNRTLQVFLDAPVGSSKRKNAEHDTLKAYEYLIPNTISRFVNVPFSVDPDDLEIAARIGLWQALLHYDQTRLVDGKPVAFVTYAIASIRKSISRAIRESSWSKAAADHEKAINKATAHLQQTLNRNPTSAELAEYLEVTEGRLSEMIESRGHNRPLYLYQTPVSGAFDDGEAQLADILPSKALSHHDQMLLKQQVQVLIKLTNNLRGNLRDAAMLLFQGYAVKEVAEILNVSPSRAGMIVSTVRERMYENVILGGHGDLFSDWLRQIQPGARPGRIRRRRRRPRMALMFY